METSEIQLYESSLPGSSGGVISAVQITDMDLNNLFSDVAEDDLVDGKTVYKKIFVKNLSVSETLTTALLWVLLQPTNYEVVRIGPGTASDDDPIAVNFINADSQTDALSLGSIAPGDSVGVWISKTTQVGTPRFSNQAFMQMAVAGA